MLLKDAVCIYLLCGWTIIFYEHSMSFLEKNFLLSKDHLQNLTPVN